jgi:hypothetical protein
MYPLLSTAINAHNHYPAYKESDMTHPANEFSAEDFSLLLDITADEGEEWDHTAYDHADEGSFLDDIFFDE